MKNTTPDSEAELREKLAKAMKFWQASDGTWWSASHRVNVDKRLDIIMALITAHQEAYFQQRLAEVMPEKKTLETDLDEDNIGAFDDPHKFCVECGQYEYEGVLDCKCVGFNICIDTINANVAKEGKK